MRMHMTGVYTLASIPEGGVATNHGAGSAEPSTATNPDGWGKVGFQCRFDRQLWRVN